MLFYVEIKCTCGRVERGQQAERSVKEDTHSLHLQQFTTYAKIPDMWKVSAQRYDK